MPRSDTPPETRQNAGSEIRVVGSDLSPSPSAPRSDSASRSGFRWLFSIPKPTPAPALPPLPPVPDLPPVPAAPPLVGADVSESQPDDAIFDDSAATAAAAPASASELAPESVEELQRVLSRLPVRPPGAFARFWRKFGAESLLLSVGIHVLLLLIALTTVVAVVVVEEKKPETFSTGAGGGNGGEVATMTQHRVKPPKTNLVRSPAKIVSRSSSASLVLPDIPTLNLSSLTSGAQGGALSKGIGGGAGGGSGAGFGIGAGGGRNFVAKFVMGTPVRADKIAVYLDSSGSMTPYLPLVKKEIYAQFPDADVFEVQHIVTSIADGKVRGGRAYKLPPVPRNIAAARRRAAAAARAKAGDAPKSSTRRSAILRKWGDHFAAGSVGAWMDIMLFEKYDALVIFSDFQDGIVDSTKKSGQFGPKIPDSPAGKEPEWERQWLARCADRKAGPRIYLFSIQVPPQSIWQRCAEASGGEAKMVRHLRKIVLENAAAPVAPPAPAGKPAVAPPAAPAVKPAAAPVVKPPAPSANPL